MVYKIFGTELEANFFNPDEMEKLENEIEKCQNLMNLASKEEGRLSVGIRKQCGAVIDCIDNVFGDDAAFKVFGTNTDLMNCIDAFKDVCFISVQMSEQIKEKGQQIIDVVKKYSVDRAERNEPVS